MIAPVGRRLATSARRQKTLLLFFRLFVLAAFAHGLEPLFTTLGAIGGALDELGTHQLNDGLLSAVTLAQPTRMIRV